MKARTIQAAWFCIIAFGILGLVVAALGAFILRLELKDGWVHANRSLIYWSVFILTFGISLLLDSFAVFLYIKLKGSRGLTYLRVVCFLSFVVMIGVTLVYVLETSSIVGLPLLPVVLFLPVFCSLLPQYSEEGNENEQDINEDQKDI